MEHALPLTMHQPCGQEVIWGWWICHWLQVTPILIMKVSYWCLEDFWRTHRPLFIFISFSQLSNPQLNHNSTQPNITLVGFAYTCAEQRSCLKLYGLASLLMKSVVTTHTCKFQQTQIIAFDCYFPRWLPQGVCKIILMWVLIIVKSSYWTIVILG